LRAAGDERRHPQALAHDERSGPLRPAELVRREGDEIGAPAFAIDRDLPRRLDGIDEKRDLRGAARRSDLGDRLKNSGLVVGRLEAGQRGALVELGGEGGGVDAAGALARHLDDVETHGLQRVRRVENRGVLDRRDDDAPSIRGGAIGDAAHRGGDSLGSSAREHDVLRRSSGQGGRPHALPASRSALAARPSA
jgi:hypothetical protein